MFKGKMEPGDRVVFMSETECFADRAMKPCTVRFVDSHTTTVVFDDGYRMCVYPGELVSLLDALSTAIVRMVTPEPWETIGRFQYPLTEDEGSLA
jgi:hypothetical protein